MNNCPKLILLLASPSLKDYTHRKGYDSLWNIALMADWMIVYETPVETEAYIVAGRLKVEGIQAMVYRQPGAAALGITIGRLGSITVLVQPSDYERALSILEPDELEELPNTTDDITYIGLEDDDTDQLAN
jgi:hypothetical protein